MTTERTRDQVLAELADVAASMDRLTARLDGLREGRLALWAEGRALAEPIPHRVLGETAGVGEEAVLKALRKMRRDEAAAVS
jgi:hypothetical protein